MIENIVVTREKAFPQGHQKVSFYGKGLMIFGKKHNKSIISLTINPLPGDKF